MSLKSLFDLVNFQPDDVIVMLGDYVDRGPDSKGVLDFLIEAKKSLQIVHLLGNHEIMMLGAREDPAEFDNWIWDRVGGAATLESYPGGNMAGIPSDHWAFIGASLPYYELDNAFFVHANAYSDVALSDQPDYMLYWEHLTLSGAAAHYSGKKMVCGHTAQKSGVPLNLGHTVCIDTCAYGGGWLTCLEVDTGRYWQTNEVGGQFFNFL